MSELLKFAERFEKLRMIPMVSATNLYKELEEEIPTIETKIGFASLDECILEEKDIDGNIVNVTYLLKRSINGKKFKYERTLDELTTIEDVRSNAWKNLDSWELRILNNLENQTKTKTDNDN